MWFIIKLFFDNKVQIKVYKINNIILSTNFIQFNYGTKIILVVEYRFKGLFYKGPSKVFFIHLRDMWILAKSIAQIILLDHSVTKTSQKVWTKKFIIERRKSDSIVLLRVSRDEQRALFSLMSVFVSRLLVNTANIQYWTIRICACNFSRIEFSMYKPTSCRH